MDLMVNPVITDFQQDVNGDIKMLKIGQKKEDAWANIAEQGASAKLDNNKTATINVSTYTEPVVINPTSGKDGMKKATITLSNIPSPSGVTTLYAWKDTEDYIICLPVSVAPSTKADVMYIDDAAAIETSVGNLNTELHSAIATLGGEDTYTRISDTVFSMNTGGGESTYTRYSEGDVTLSVW